MGKISISFQERSGKPGGGKGILIQIEKTGALSTVNNQMVFVSGFIPNQSAKTRGIGYEVEKSPTMIKGYTPVICIQGSGMTSKGSQGSGISRDICYTLNSVDHHGVYVLNDQGGSVMDVTKDKTATLRSQSHSHEPLVLDPSADHKCDGKESPTMCMDVGFFTSYEEQSGALLARQYKDPPIINCVFPEKTGSLMASGYAKLGTQEAMNGMYPVTEDEQKNKSVRRLTPMECERLQGFPDGWTDIPGASDTKRYQALGNSIALPFWKHLAYRFADIGDVETIGSLFDGIGGFPLSFEEAGVETLWTSEIEPFCEEVVRIRFGTE